MEQAGEGIDNQRSRSWSGFPNRLGRRKVQGRDEADLGLRSQPLQPAHERIQRWSRVRDIYEEPARPRDAHDRHSVATEEPDFRRIGHALLEPKREVGPIEPPATRELNPPRGVEPRK